MIISGLIPLRFFCLLFHLVVLFSLLQSGDENIKACLPLKYEEKDYESKKGQMTIGIFVSAALLLFELLCFVCGTSMFSHTQALLSVVSHFSATLGTVYFIIDHWDCDIFWWIFGLCNVFPAVTEAVTVSTIFILRKPV